MIFDKYTKEKAGNHKYQLLLVDRYCSHVNLDFFDYANKYQIIVLILLSHTTYQLYILDVNYFCY